MADAVIPLQIGVLQFGAQRPALLQAWPGAAPGDRKLPARYQRGDRRDRGLSHQVHGERCGFNNPQWDAQFVDMLVNDPEKLAEMTLGEYATLGGWKGLK
jgi:gallate dioxygenase